MEQVEHFIYLGASSTEKGHTIKEVQRRVAIAKRVNADLLPIPLEGKRIQLKIGPIMSYGSETYGST